MATPLVSVVIPVHLPVRYLAAAIDSVRAQTWRSHEIIVVNDGSPATPEVEAIVRARGELVYVAQPNRGPGAARNAGIRAARGEFLAFLDADDWWGPEFLTRQLAVFDADGSCDLVYCNAQIIAGEAVAPRTIMDSCPSVGEVSLHALLSERCTVITSAVVARTAVIRAAGGFDESLWRGQDFDLWLRLAQRGTRIRYHTGALTYHRKHGENLSGDSLTQHRRVLGVLTRPCWQALTGAERDALEARLARHRAALAVLCGKRHLADGRFDEARKEFTAAVSAGGGWKVRAVLLMLATAPRLARVVTRNRLQ